MISIKELSSELEAFAPLDLQESYDNSGLLVGDPEMQTDKALITLDVTEEVLQEAIEGGFPLIISHHPLIFKGLKKLTGKNEVERIVIKAIQNNIAIYAMHTNADNILNGVNGMIAKIIGLQNTSILQPKEGLLRKLVVFVPTESAEKVRAAIFKAGAGHIGNYDSCSFNLQGRGSFRAGEGTDPYVGEKNKLHFEEEVRIESIYPVYKQRQILKEMIEAHPYEEVAYDIYPLENHFESTGSGLIGELAEEVSTLGFLKSLKENFRAPCLKYTKAHTKSVKKVALCGGAGSFLIDDAIRSKADVFITGDVKYHDFFRSENRMMIIDVGHYESEQFTKELIFTVLKQKITNFAPQISKVNTNPVNYM